MSEAINFVENASQDTDVLSTDDLALVQHLTNLPRYIAQHHDIDELAGVVLHELGHDSGFALKKAIYLLDNPDFDYLVGVAGFSRDDCSLHQGGLWDDPASFCQDMKEAAFYQQIKGFLRASLAKLSIDLRNASEVAELAASLGLENARSFSWPVRHGNYGLLLVEEGASLNEWHISLLDNLSSLLGLCGR